jgi:hypothetical protein
MLIELLWITNADFDVIRVGQGLINFLYPSDTGEKVGV